METREEILSLLRRSAIAPLSVEADNRLPSAHGGADDGAGDFDEVSATSRADVEQVPKEPGLALAIIDGFGRLHGLSDFKQAAGHREFGAAVRVGTKAEVADPAEAVR
jgi:hypothetical protein